MLERYRLFLVLSGLVLTAAILFGLERTRFGAMVRACVDSGRAASGSGLNTSAVFAVTFGDEASSSSDRVSIRVSGDNSRG